MKFVSIAVAFAAAVGWALPAAAQNVNLAPTHGNIPLISGFVPDPVTREVTAGGSTSLGGIGCSGFAANAPTVVVDYDAGFYPLTFRSRSSTDTVLAIRSPSGDWRCNDDGWEGSNPQVQFEDPASGIYHVWVGGYSAGTARATLLITETASSGEDEDDVWGEESNAIDIRVCNESGRNATVAISYVEEGSREFTNRGWFAVNIGTCIDLATTHNENFYLYADAADGSDWSWGGSHALCVEYPGPYRFISTGEEYCASHQDVRDFEAVTSEPGEFTWRLR